MTPAESGRRRRTDEAALPRTSETLQVAATRRIAIMAAQGLVITPTQDMAVVSFKQASILDAQVVEDIGKELYAIVDQQAKRKVVLDFAAVKFLSSQMIGVLVTLHKKSVAIRGRVILCGLQPNLRQIFSITSVDKFLKIVKNEAEAAALLSDRS
jgi:anti-sigma B factor antagonist